MVAKRVTLTEGRAGDGPTLILGAALPNDERRANKKTTTIQKFRMIVY